MSEQHPPTIRAFCEDQILQQIRDGRTDLQILQAVARNFRGANTTRQSLMGYRTAMRQAGHRIPRKRPERYGR